MFKGLSKINSDWSRKTLAARPAAASETIKLYATPTLARHLRLAMATNNVHRQDTTSQTKS